MTIAEIETKAEGIKIFNGSGAQRQMRLIDEKSITPPLFRGDRRKYMSWAKYLCPGFRKMLDWAERE